jgi:hypothetical protein
MIIGKGEKIHVVMRRMFDAQVQRHFAGDIEDVDGPIVRVTGYVFIYDIAAAQYKKKG